tara:strand:+ start:217 stop:399 length:183 start_codon:yes stop_codon:yes gene_type:complete
MNKLINEIYQTASDLYDWVDDLSDEELLKFRENIKGSAKSIINKTVDIERYYNLKREEFI